jgi:hypothetical protein
MLMNLQAFVRPGGELFLFRANVWSGGAGQFDAAALVEGRFR